MTMQLKFLLDSIKNTMGLQHKSDIQVIANHLRDAYSNPFYPNGDDTAVIPTENGYDLFSGEGFLTEFVEQDPWFAGWCGVMVNVSDIAAMGGRPTAVINSYWGKDNDITAKIFAGMSAASDVFQVPIVGGHTNLRAEKSQLAVSILGKANTVLSSFAAKPRQCLIAAIDCRGEYREPFSNWNASTQAPAERLRGDIALLPTIAENHLATACKDISQAGLLGTCLMMLESSRVGAFINLENIPKPEHIEWQQWLCSFPSFGYLLSSDEDKADMTITLFKERGIHAASIGYITSRQSMIVTYENETETFWDLTARPLTNIANKENTMRLRECTNTNNKPIRESYA